MENMIIRSSASHTLISYWMLKGTNEERVEQYFRTFVDAGMRVVLDSGAYSAWTQGVVIDLDDFALFYKKYEKYIDYAFSLDVIGDHIGSQVNHAYLCEYYPELSFAPVWHVFSPLEALTRLFDFNPTLIGLGGITHAPGNSRTNFIRTGVTYCQERDILTHALGVGSLEMLSGLPIDFADSTSWHVFSRYGKIWTPFEGYNILKVSTQTRLNDPLNNERIDAFFADTRRAEYVEMVLSRLDIDFGDIFVSNEAVALFNLEALIYLLETRQPKKWKRRVVF